MASYAQRANTVYFDSKQNQYYTQAPVYTQQDTTYSNIANMWTARRGGFARNYLADGPADGGGAPGGFSGRGASGAASSMLLDSVESAGIDPETGREQFRKKLGGATAMLGA